MLIAARALLGVAGATLMPSTLGLISTMFRDQRQRTSAVSLWAACLLAGTAIAVAGGVLLQFFWWEFGLPDRPAGHGRAGHRRAVAAAGAPEPGAGPAGPGQRGPSRWPPCCRPSTA